MQNNKTKKESNLRFILWDVTVAHEATTMSPPDDHGHGRGHVGDGHIHGEFENINRESLVDPSERQTLKTYIEAYLF